MKNYLPLALVLCGAAGTTLAGPVGSQEALEIAKQFYLSKLGASGQAKAPADIDFTIAFDSNDGATADGVRKAKAVTGDPTYYVVNAGASGYVVVSGDDEALPVLGYTLDGTIDAGNLPVNLRDWLDFYDNEINALRADTREQGLAVNPVTSPTDQYKTVIYPLLGDIKWNQDGPYNGQCPEYNNARTVTGCLATAIGQVLRYYRYPTTATGSVNYTTEELGLQVRVNYDGVTYDYDKMLPNYGVTPGTAEERAEVAKFLYHIGALAKMNYMPASMGGSGANNYDLIDGLIEHFGYSNRMNLINRFNTSTEDWHAAIQQELAAGRPVFHTGSGDGGHAFVCDGYDGAGMYHFNWGWGGTSDGYFVLSSLVPTTQGIGGNTMGFDYMQSIITNLQPASAGDIDARTELALFDLEGDGLTPSKTDAALGETISLSFSVMTSGPFTFTGFVGAIVLDDNGNVVEELGRTMLSGLRGGYYRDNLSLRSSFPSTLADGTYRLTLGYKETKFQDDEWHVMHSWYAATPDQLVANVSGGRVTLSELGNADITATQVTVPERLVQNRNAQFTITFGNEGYSYYSWLGVLIRAKEGAIQQSNLSKVQYINNGDENTVTVSGRITLTPGTYLVYPMYDSNNDINHPQYTTVPGVEPVEVEVTAATGNPSFTLMPFDDGTTVINTKSGMGYNSVFNIRVKNDGGYFAGEFRVRPTTATSSAAYGYAEIGEGETVDIQVSGEMMLAAGQYTAQVAYNNGNGFIPIGGNYTLNVDAFTSIDETAGEGGLRLYPNPADDQVTVEGNGIDMVQLYDTTGALVLVQDGGSDTVTLNVGDLPAGLYFARVLSQDNATVMRVIKK